VNPQAERWESVNNTSGYWFQKSDNNVKKKRLWVMIVSVFLFVSACFLPSLVNAEERIPRPEFQTDYELPGLTIPQPRSGFYEYLDVAVLIICLILASFFSLKIRFRALLFILMIFSLIYFGFWRKGCVCPIGSIQNMTLVFFDSSYRVPLTVVVFFILPLLFALFFGRTFCAAVCPLGALQDVFVLKPVKIPQWILQPLGLVPYIYLGIGVLGVATGAGFLICRFDPFVGIFRISGRPGMLLYGAGILIAGVFIARPYCRFLCPYSVILKWTSRFSRWHVTISPDECIECTLCEDSCPFGAIRKPTPELISSEKNSTGIRRLLILLILLPVLIFGGGFLGSRLDVPLSRIHRTVRLAEQVNSEDLGIIGTTTLDSRTFRETGKSKSELMYEALLLRKGFKRGGLLFGSFLGLVFGIKMIELSIRRKRTRFEPDRAACFSCGRCFEYCVKEKERRKELGFVSKLDIFSHLTKRSG
jgi:ferredoxin